MKVTLPKESIEYHFFNECVKAYHYRRPFPNMPLFRHFRKKIYSASYTRDPAIHFRIYGTTLQPDDLWRWMRRQIYV